MQQLAQLNKDYNLLSQKARNYIDDCLPFIRTEYYRPIMAKQLWILLVMSVLFYVVMVVEMLLILPSAVRAKEDWKFNLFDNHIESTGCAIWRANDDLSIKERVKISQPRTQFTVFTLIEILMISLPLGSIFSISITLSLMCLHELSIEIAVQVDRLQLVIELNDIIIEANGIHGSSQEFDFESEGDVRHDFQFRELALLHQQNVRFPFGLTSLTPIMDADRKAKHLQNGHSGHATELRHLAIQQLATSNRDYHLSIHLNALIKVYIGVRALAHQVERTSRNLTQILSFFYICNYGFAFVWISYSRKFHGRYHNSMEFSLLALLIINIVIATAARVQAKSKRLLNQIWQLVALTYPFEDIRIRHMRVLWIKQAISFTEEYGMTMKAYHIPVTYATMIQLTLWTSSLVILAFGH